MNKPKPLSSKQIKILYRELSRRLLGLQEKRAYQILATGKINIDKLKNRLS